MTRPEGPYDKPLNSLEQGTTFHDGKTLFMKAFAPMASIHFKSKALIKDNLPRYFEAMQQFSYDIVYAVMLQFETSYSATAPFPFPQEFRQKCFEYINTLTIDPKVIARKKAEHERECDSESAKSAKQKFYELIIKQGKKLEESGQSTCGRSKHIGFILFEEEIVKPIEAELEHQRREAESEAVETPESIQAKEESFQTKLEEI